MGVWRNRCQRWPSGGHLEVEKLPVFVHLEAQALTPVREGELAARAGVRHDLAELNAAIAGGIVYAGADDVAGRPRLLGRRRGLALWRHLHGQHTKNMCRP